MKQPHTLMAPDKAEALADRMNRLEDGDGWSYRVKHDPTGRGHSFIEIYDENGEFVERL